MRYKYGLNLYQIYAIFSYYAAGNRFTRQYHSLYRMKNTG